MRAWMFSSVTSRGAPGERLAQRRVEGIHDRRDRQRHRLDAARCAASAIAVVDAPLRRERRRHHRPRRPARPRAPLPRWRPSARCRCPPTGRAAPARSRTCARSRASRAPARRRSPILPASRQAAIGVVCASRSTTTTSSRNAARARDHAAARIDHGAPPVEDQLVVAAHLVDVHDRHAVLAGQGAEHALAEPLLARLEGRGRQVQHDRRARLARLLDRDRGGTAARCQKSRSFQMSSQMLTAQRRPAISDHRRPVPASKYRSSSNTS